MDICKTVLATIRCGLELGGASFQSPFGAEAEALPLDSNGLSQGGLDRLSSVQETS